MLEVVLAQTEAQYQQVRELLEEYIAWDATQLAQLGLDAQAALDFYFASGKEKFPGVYAPPDGRMFLASYSAQTAGCGAFRRMTADTCEMRRMYVRPEFRGKQIGRRLGNELFVGARRRVIASCGWRPLHTSTEPLRCTLLSDSKPASLTAPFLKAFGRSSYVWNWIYGLRLDRC